MVQSNGEILAAYVPIAKKYHRYTNKSRQMQKRIADLQKLNATESHEYKKLIASLDGFCSSQDYINTCNVKENYDKLLNEVGMGCHIKN